MLELGATIEEIVAGTIALGLVGVLGGRVGEGASGGADEGAGSADEDVGADGGADGELHVRFEMVLLRNRYMRESASGVSLLGVAMVVESV